MSLIDLSLGDGEIRQAWGIRSMKLGALALRESAEDQGRHPGGERARNMILTSNYNLGARGALQDKDGKICYICLILPPCVIADIGN